MRWGKTSEDKTPWYYYIPVACSYAGAMVCTNLSIRYVSYPTMTLAKSCKPIPVLLMGLVLGKQTTWSRVWCVILISLGVSLFGWDMVSHSKNTTTTELGFVFLFVSLALDGLTGPLQDLITDNFKPSSDQLMASINIFASLLLGIGKNLNYSYLLNNYNSIMRYRRNARVNSNESFSF